MAFAIRPGQTVLFIGDSITDCGRRNESAPLGNGYVKMVNDLIAARYPSHGLTVINTGIGGNTVRDLRDRWTDDCIRHRPDWLSIKIGINDLHRWLRNGEGLVTPEQFAELYDEILARAKAETRARLVLIDPFYISTDSSPGSHRAHVLKHLPLYQRTVDRMAGNYKALHVRTHRLFQEQLRRHLPDRFCPEPVHPNAAGHMVIAHGWLKALGW
ncbi:MAG: Acetylxylan esterase [Phycisphaerae bacterium]|nr:Acetylxylan esterase [Phycisphaerae bacterium]